MTIDQVENVAGVALREGVRDSTMSKLRALFRDIHLTFCNDDDILGAEPILRYSRLNVYLVDGRPHCPVLTGDLESATGLVLAEVDERRG